MSPSRCQKKNPESALIPLLLLLCTSIQFKNKSWPLFPQHIPNLVAPLCCHCHPQSRPPLPSCVCHSLPTGLRGCHPHLSPPPPLQLLRESREMLLKCKSDQTASRLKTLQGLPLYLKSNPSPYPASPGGGHPLTSACQALFQAHAAPATLASWLSSRCAGSWPDCRPLNLELPLLGSPFAGSSHGCRLPLLRGSN